MVTVPGKLVPVNMVACFPLNPVLTSLIALTKLDLLVVFKLLAFPHSLALALTTVLISFKSPALHLFTSAILVLLFNAVLFVKLILVEKIKIVFKWIKNHKYIFVTLVFLAIILVLDDNNVIGHIRNRTTINRLTSEIEKMEADSINTQNKQNLYTIGDLGVMEDEARKRGALKNDEEAFYIKK